MDDVVQYALLVERNTDDLIRTLADFLDERVRKYHSERARERREVPMNNHGTGHLGNPPYQPWPYHTPKTASYIRIVQVTQFSA